MNERLVFFCDRDQRPCYFYRWGKSEGGASYLYQVYCRSALDDEVVEHLGQRIDKAQLSDQVAAAGGGLVAETKQTGDMVSLSIRAVPAASYEPCAEMYLLAPGTEPKPLAIDERGMVLTAGELALVPASADDAANLMALFDHLKRLPGDYRGLVLDVLRQPGIDGSMRRLTLRINQLLARLGKAPAEAAGVCSGQDDQLNERHEEQAKREEQGATPQARISGFWLWFFSGLLILNLAGVGLGLGLGTILMERVPATIGEPVPPMSVKAGGDPQASAAQQQTECDEDAAAAEFEDKCNGMLAAQRQELEDQHATELAACQAQGGTSASQSAPEDGATAPTRAINELIKLWMIQAAYGLPPDNNRRIAAETHFVDDGKSIFVDDWLADRPDGTKEPYFRRQERFAYGIAKLVLLQNSINIEGKALTDLTYRTAIKKKIEKALAATDGDAPLGENDQHLLAWLACEIFPQGLLNGEARFVRVDKVHDPDDTEKGEGDKRDSDADIGVACDDIDNDKVSAAIQRHREKLLESTE